MIPHSLNLDNSGVTLSRTPATVPPLGLLIPASQTVAASVSSTLDGLVSHSIDPLPPGVEVILGGGSTLYGWDGGTWEDGILGGSVSGSTVISGDVLLRNLSATDIGITW